MDTTANSVALTGAIPGVVRHTVEITRRRSFCQLGAWQARPDPDVGTEDVARPGGRAVDHRRGEAGRRRRDRASRTVRDELVARGRHDERAVGGAEPIGPLEQVELVGAGMALPTFVDQLDPPVAASSAYSWPDEQPTNTRSPTTRGAVPRFPSPAKSQAVVPRPESATAVTVDPLSACMRPCATAGIGPALKLPRTSPAAADTMRSPGVMSREQTEPAATAMVPTSAARGVG